MTIRCSRPRSASRWMSRLEPGAQVSARSCSERGVPRVGKCAGARLAMLSSSLFRASDYVLVAGAPGLPNPRRLWRTPGFLILVASGRSAELKASSPSEGQQDYLSSSLLEGHQDKESSASPLRACHAGGFEAARPGV